MIDSLWDSWSNSVLEFVTHDMQAPTGGTLKGAGKPMTTRKNQRIQPGQQGPMLPSILTCHNGCFDDYEVCDMSMMESQPDYGPSYLMTSLQSAELYWCLKQSTCKAMVLAQKLDDLLNRYKDFVQKQELRTWKKSLSDRNRPTPSLFRWLRGGPPPGPLILRDGQKVTQTNQEFFRSLRLYWEDILCRDINPAESAYAWLTDHPQSTSEECEETSLKNLEVACHSLKGGTSAGMDGWVPEIIRALPKKAICTLHKFFRAVEKWGRWPTALVRVRTQFLSKVQDVQVIPIAGDWRPIALLSCWIRVWAKWRLLQTPPQVFEGLHEALTAGLPGRSTYSAMLHIMMDIEESLAPKANRNHDTYWGFLTLDASKYFDRIRHSETLDLALQGGVSLQTLRPLAGFLSQMHRVFAAGGLLDEEVVFPKNGLLQGDPLSVLLCNICVSTWASKLVKGQTQVQAYIDDRSIIGPHAIRPSSKLGMTVGGGMKLEGGSLMRRRPF